MQGKRGNSQKRKCCLSTRKYLFLLLPLSLFFSLSIFGPLHVFIMFSKPGLCSCKVIVQPPPPHTHTYAHTMAPRCHCFQSAISSCGAKSVWKAQTAWRERSGFKESVMFVSVSAENYWSGTSNINTLTESRRGVCLYDLNWDRLRWGCSSDSLVQEEAVILEMWEWVVSH